jgi:hypothetical protein
VPRKNTMELAAEQKLAAVALGARVPRGLDYLTASGLGRG